MSTAKYKRILLKLSGEALMGDTSNMFDKRTLDCMISQIENLIKLNIKIGIVIGGGNIFRGVNGKELGLQRANADSMGMLATIMNGIALKDFLANRKIKAKLYSALAVQNIAKGYSRDSMLSRLEDGNIIIFAGGTGNPFFTTDSSAALRAIEMNADLLIKATKVDGVFDKDPKQYSDAIRYSKLTFDEAINKKLKVMDISAFDLCREHNIDINVCNIFNPNSLQDVVLGLDQGTIIHN